MTPYSEPVEIFRIPGGQPLSGEVSVSGAKNSVLKLMAISMLTVGQTTITNVPRIHDVTVMSEVLRRLGCEVEHRCTKGADPTQDALIITVPEKLNTEADYDLVRRMRASINVLGPLLARAGEARVAHPGGDAIGSRGLDYHIHGLRRMGATITSEHGYVIARAQHLSGAHVWLEFPSVGATENILTAAVLARGTTVIENAAREPEIIDICTMLRSMGAQITGEGTSTIEIVGVSALSPVTHRTVSDRIVAGTWAFAAAITHGDVTVRYGVAEHLQIALEKLSAAGAEVTEYDDDKGFRVCMRDRPKAVDFVTLPYPGFATDMLPMAIALASVSEGHSLLTENVFDARFMFVNEMMRLGAEIRTDGHHAVVHGKEWLSGAPVQSTDIRAGAGLVLAGLRAEGDTEVSDVYHIDRGYPDFLNQLEALGVHIERCKREALEFP